MPSTDLDKFIAEAGWGWNFLRLLPGPAKRLLEQRRRAFCKEFAHLGFREDMTWDEMKEHKRELEEGADRLAGPSQTWFKDASEVTDRDVLRKRRRISAYWFVVLQGIAIVVFWALSTETSPWWLDAIGYLAGFLAFGALIEVVKTTWALR